MFGRRVDQSAWNHPSMGEESVRPLPHLAPSGHSRVSSSEGKRCHLYEPLMEEAYFVNSRRASARDGKFP